MAEAELLLVNLLNLPWVCLVLTVILFLVWIISRWPKKQKAILPSDNELAVAKLQQQLRRLESRYHAQMDFFVSFPEVVKSLTAALSTSQVTSACSRGISALLYTRSLAIFLAEDEAHLRLEDGADFPPELRGNLRCPLGESGFWDILQNHGVSDIIDHDRARAWVSTHGLPDELAVPICYGDSLLGMILMARARGEPQVVRRLLAMTADLTGVALHAARKVSLIQDQADTDALTRLANRRLLMARTTKECQRCLSYQTRTSLAMIDVDHFKQYNDQNGHVAGDQVLQEIARLVLSTTRKTDLVARYGGEEFSVIMAGADSDQALHHAERIRRTIAASAFPHGEKQPLGQVTISVGVATFPDHAVTVESFFQAADQALYQAKSQGRNQVVIYTSPAIE